MKRIDFNFFYVIIILIHGIKSNTYIGLVEISLPKLGGINSRHFFINSINKKYIDGN